MAIWLATLDITDLKNFLTTGFIGNGFQANAVIAENDTAITQIAYHFDCNAILSMCITVHQNCINH
jgi:hypothetical protein